LTGDPAALVAALKGLDGYDDRPEIDKRTAYAGVRGLCFLPYGFDNDTAASTDSLSVETRSHPPTAERIERLQSVARSLETGS
jgi:heat shock protein HtpX